MISKNYAIKLFFCAFILINHSLFACGPEANDRGFRLFFKKIDIQSNLYDYNFNRSRSLYSNTYSNQDNVDSNQFNSIEKDWSNHFNQQFSEKEISDFVFNANNISKTTFENRQKSGNAFQNYLIEKDTLLLHYFKLLADYNTYLNTDADNWQYESYVYKQDSSKLFSMIDETAKIYSKTKDIFLKWRCAYHIVRMAHFHKYEYSANKFYEKYVKPLPEINSIIVAWCWGLKGGICSCLDNKNEAFYHFAKKFKKQNYSIETHTDFKLLDSINKNVVFKYCKNNDDSASVRVALGITNSKISIDLIEDAYKQGVYGEELTLLWQRELQKFEEGYIYHKLIDFNQTDHYYYYDETTMPKNIDKQFDLMIALTEKIIAENKTSFNAQFNNGLTYLYLVKKDYQNAQKHLSLCNTFKPDSIDQLQHQMNELLFNILKNKRINKNELTEFCNNVKQNAIYKNEEKESYDLFMYNFAAPTLLNQKDTLDALYAFALRNDYSYMLWTEQSKDSISFLTSSEAVSNFLNYSCDVNYVAKLQKSINVNTNSPFIEWCKKEYTFYTDSNSFNFLLLHKEVCNQNWDKALQIAKQIPNEIKNTVPFYNPFIIHYDDVRSAITIDTFQKNTFTLDEILLIGKKLKEKTLNSQKPQDYFNYGMFLFNNTYYGKNSYVMDDNTIEYRYGTTPIYSQVKKMPTLEYYFDYYSIIKSPINENALAYYNCSQATAQFKKAYEGFTTIEQKAATCFMLAKTTHYNAPAPKRQKNEYGWYDNVPEKWNGKDYDYYVYNSITNPYFKELNTKYKSSKTFKNAYDECSYFKLYIDGL